MQVPHLTMKCGKTPTISKLNDNYTIYKVKIMNMPIDITYDNLQYMLKD